MRVWNRLCRLWLTPPPRPATQSAIVSSTGSRVAPGEEAANAEAAQDDDLGLAIGLSFGGGLLLALLAVATCIWYRNRKRRMQQQQPSISTVATPQVEVTKI